VELIAYLRVSLREQGDSGLGLAAQRTALANYAQGHGHTIVAWHEDIASGAATTRKGKVIPHPGRDQALSELKAGNAEALVVAKLDRVSRSVVDFGALLARARQEGWAFISIDLGVDTTTPTGELIANVLMAVAQWERRTIGQRTSDALQAHKANGNRLGRPSTVSPEIRRHVTRLRSRGMSQERIADWLNDHNYTTAQGARWRQPTVRRVLRTIQLDQEAKAAR
jgi:DNA invertase Pin-like site-specific DNA recombinase